MSRPLTENPKRKTEAAAFHRRVFAHHGNRCYWCGAHATDAAHIYGRAHLGNKRYEMPEANGRPACRGCHRRQTDGLIAFALSDRRAAAIALNSVLKVIRIEVPTE